MNTARNCNNTTAGGGCNSSLHIINGMAADGDNNENDGYAVVSEVCERVNNNNNKPT